MPLDPSSGTHIYVGTETAGPAPTMLNRLATSVRDVIVTLKNRLTALESGWVSFTPAFANLTIGTATNAKGKVRKIGTTVQYIGSFTFGTGSAVGGTPVQLLLPYASVAYDSFQILGALGLVDSGVTYQVGQVAWSTTSAATLLQHGSGSGITATTPWTWNAGDKITWNITYESAA